MLGLYLHKNMLTNVQKCLTKKLMTDEKRVIFRDQTYFTVKHPSKCKRITTGYRTSILIYFCYEQQ